MTPEATGYEPRFDYDYTYGRQGELLVNGLAEGLQHGDVRFETKRKRYRDCFLYVEQEHDPGRHGAYRPSGISVSEADYWSFVVADTGIAIWIPTTRLRRAVALGAGQLRKEEHGSCPTHGRLVDLNYLLRERP